MISGGLIPSVSGSILKTGLFPEPASIRILYGGEAETDATDEIDNSNPMTMPIMIFFNCCLLLGFCQHYTITNKIFL